MFLNIQRHILLEFPADQIVLRSSIIAPFVGSKWYLQRRRILSPSTNDLLSYYTQKIKAIISLQPNTQTFFSFVQILSPGLSIPPSPAVSGSSFFQLFSYISAFPSLLTPFIQHLKIFFLNFMNCSHLFSCIFIPFTARTLECIIYSPYLFFSHFMLFISPLQHIYSFQHSTK